MIADWIGRKVPFLASLAMMTLSTFLLIIGIYEENSPVMIISQIMIGLSVTGIVGLSYVITP